MTIDERIEALTMHLEVLTHMHQDFEKKTSENMDRLTTTMERLANIVIAHEERIERLEDGK